MIPHIEIIDYDYPLPPSAIPLYPPDERENAKLLLYKNHEMADYNVVNIPDLLPHSGLVIFNNSKVLKARLFFQKSTGATIEVFCLEPLQPLEYHLALSARTTCSWKCLVGNLKRWKSSDELTITKKINGQSVTLSAHLKEQAANTVVVNFTWDNPLFCFSELLEHIGNIPLPPYLHRKTEPIDITRYQTTFSQPLGSVAAPTAGLHFTPQLTEKIAQHQTLDYITLHVGAGTFQPVTSENIANHNMHREYFNVHKSLLQHLLSHRGNITAVGTTSVRTLESLYWLGVKVSTGAKPLMIEQWEVYQSLAQHNITVENAIFALLEYLEKNKLETLESYTSLIIVPGYSFKIVSQIITNFHQPQSTLLLLVSAFIGKQWKTLYQHALQSGYRFLSYGDTSLLFSQ